MMIPLGNQKRVPPALVAVLVITAFVVYFAALSITKNNFIPFFQLICFLVPSLALINKYQLLPCIKTGVWNLHTVACIFLVSLSVTMGLNQVVNQWVIYFPLPPEMQAAFLNMMHLGKPFGLITDLAVIALVPAICEEFFFRGFLLNALAQGGSDERSIVITAIIFAAYHLNPWLFLFYFVLGYYFGFLARQYRHLPLGLAAAVTAHFINNAYGVVMYHLN